MKLWHKILLVCLLLYTLAFNVSSVIFLSQSHLQAIASETSRAFSDQAIINERVNAGILATGSAGLADPRPLIQRYAEYYKSRKIELVLYQVSAKTMTGTLSLPSLDTQMLQAGNGEQRALIQTNRNMDNNLARTIVVSSRLPDYPDYVLIYARDISTLYADRTRMIRIFILIDLGMSILIGLAAYFLARRLTQPLEKLGQAAQQIADGQYSLIVPESRDETARLIRSFNRMSEAVWKREQDLAEQTEQRQFFIDNLTHEMNTPLTAIQGYAEYLQKARATVDQQQKAAETIESEARRLRDLYDKLMQLILARKHGLDTRLVQLEPLFNEIARTMSIQLEQSQIRLETDSKLQVITADPALLQILLTNLIRNSIQASTPGAVILLSAKRAEDGRAMLTVEDQGRGIPVDQISHIFEPFYRVDRSRSRRTGGAGLGLTLCQEIAHLHQGELIVTSRQGVGTSISLLLPEK